MTCGWYRVSKGEYLISTDKSWLDLEVIYRFLSASHWAAGIPLEVVKRSIENSLTFGLYKDSNQIGLARVITDYATFAYLAELFSPNSPSTPPRVCSLETATTTRPRQEKSWRRWA